MEEIMAKAVTHQPSELPHSASVENQDLVAPRLDLRMQNIERIKATLPDNPDPYTDKYFLREKTIIHGDGLKPWVRAQVFIRKGDAQVAGIDHALAILDKYSNIRETGRVYALEDGDHFENKETVMVIEGPAREFETLETMYLGVIAAETTRVNDGVNHVDLEAAKARMKTIVELAGDRPVQYFGARHWSWAEDAAISKAAIEAGATGCSTDIGGEAFDLEGSGTIPHSLENIYALYHGKDRAVVEATRAFDRHIDASVPRIALIDYNNREIADSLAVADALGERLTAVRVDTCGENVAQGALISADCPEALELKASGVDLIDASDPASKFWYGTGVTVSGVYALRKALDQFGHNNVKIILTSGFGDPDKVKAFVDAEKRLNVRLFDGLGVGGIFKPCRTSTMDIVAAGESAETLQPICKTGRSENPNPRLKLVWGKATA